MSGLAINGDTVHGLAIGGQAYHDLSNLKFKDYLLLDFDTIQNGDASGLVANIDATKFIGKNVFMCWSQTEGEVGDTNYAKTSYCTDIFTLSYKNTVSTSTAGSDVIIDIDTDQDVKVFVPSDYDDFKNVHNAVGLIMLVD